MLQLPPPFAEIVLREGGDAFRRAVAEAQAGAGAGLLVWVRRLGSVDCAVILEPDEPLATARHVLLSGLTAVADALAAISPPEKPLALVWPDRVTFDGGLVGGGRLAWPAGCAEAARPDWLVFGFALRTLGEASQSAPSAALIDDGFEDFETGPFLESFARHLMLALDDWAKAGPAAARAGWRRYGTAPAHAPDLRILQAAPSWLDGGEIAA